MTEEYQIDIIDAWISCLGGFANMATRYPIKMVHNSVSKGHEFSLIFEDYALSGGALFNRFKKELRERLSQSVNPEIILIDVKDEFDLTIKKYKEWYETNKANLEIFEPYNPYSLMFDLAISTEREIQKYSTKKDKHPEPIKNLTLIPDCLIDEEYFFSLLKNPKVCDLYTVKDDQYYWHGSKNKLGGFAHELKIKQKLKNSQDLTSQDLAKIFCTFFNVKFDEKEEKQFQPERAKREYFTFIK